MTDSAETVEYAVRCADGRLLIGRYATQRDAQRVATESNEPARPCSPHTVVQRRRIVTDWQPVDGEQ